MSELIMAGNASDAGSTSKLIRLQVKNCAQLKAVGVAIHPVDAQFHGTYTPTTANIFVSQDEFNALKSDLAQSPEIGISVTSTDGNVTRFCFPSMCLPARMFQSVSREIPMPDSGVTGTATGTG